MVAADVRSANRSIGRGVGDRGPNPVPAAKLLLDPVLDLAAGAVEVLVEAAGVDRGGGERGHDEAWVRSLGQVLGLGDDAARSAPAVERAPDKVGEVAGGAALRQALQLGCGQIVGDLADQALVARQPEDVVDGIRLAPAHQRIACEARIRPQHDRDPGPARSDLGDDPCHLLDCTRRGVDVRAPQLGGEQVPTAEHIERQIAVAVVIAVEEAAFLMTVQRIVGGIEVEHDLLGRRLMRCEEEIDEQSFDGGRGMADLVVARGRGRRVLEPVQGALAGERGAGLALGLELAGEHRVVAQLVVVDQILVAERNAEHPLRHHGLDAVLHLRLGAAIDEAGGEPLDQSNRPVGRAEQERPGVRGDHAAVERGHVPKRPSCREVGRDATVIDRGDVGALHHGQTDCRGRAQALVGEPVALIGAPESEARCQTPGPPLRRQ